ncbi:hypothetical protein M408DRAFT_94658 [Serendipita vermifera MAFF 305830]|uniref:Uncharacterized protein n=1 Tax=Serendipita vermifera MAFF 305830 TaxID=933852 RepID=A0A0C3BC11_SERVB|nr:hypothetical protein M408DRAFT_94658 [Serendipita vermifera MAFF 305830]
MGLIFLSEAESLDARLGFAVLNTKDIFSWIQILHRGDEIEFSPEMAIIVPSSRKDVMWPALLMKASDGLYAPYIIRLLARSHLLLKYGLEWPDRWKAGQGKLPEQHIPDPQSAAHDPSTDKPLRENDLLAMLMVGSQITEIERVAEEIVRVVTSGGTWCRNEYVAPEAGWPAEWEEPKGTTKDVWGVVEANPIPEETTVARATLTTSASLSDASMMQSMPPPPPPQVRRQSPALSEKKASPQLPIGRVLNDDVLSNLLHAPMKMATATPPRQVEDEHKTPIPSDFRVSLPNVSKPVDNTAKSRRAKAKAKKAAKAKATNTSALESESSMAEAESDDIETNPSRSITSTPAPKWNTPTFGIVDDRLSDEEDEISNEPTSAPASVQTTPVHTVTQQDVRSLEKLSRKKGKQKEQQPPAKPPTFLKYHQKGYIPENMDATSAIDPKLAQEVIVPALVKKGGGFPVLDRNDWIRELLQLIHTDKKFVDEIYNKYKERQSTR